MVVHRCCSVPVPNHSIHIAISITISRRSASIIYGVLNGIDVTRMKYHVFDVVGFQPQKQKK